MKKKYERPEILVTKVELGVFGQYGQPDRDEIYAFPIRNLGSSE
jgi:hypothetical protein